MSDKKDLTVIIPVYGTEKYIDACLNSALKATEGLSAEIIVVNDGTKDNAGVIAKGYADRNPDRIIYFEKENGGVSDAKNFGLKNAKGEFITFLDSDDYIEPDMYKEMLEKAKEEGADCVVCDMVVDYEESGKSDYQKCAFDREELFHSLIDNMLMSSFCNKVMKRELTDGIPFPVGMNNEDVAVTPVAMGRSRKLAYVPKGFYHYIQRQGSIQNSGFSKKRFVILDTCELAINRAKDLSVDRLEKLKGALYVYQILGVPFWIIRKEPFKRRYEFLKEYMKLVDEKFPDFHTNSEVREYGTWGSTFPVRVYRKICLFLNKHKMYWLLCVVWTVAKPFVKE